MRRTDRLVTVYIIDVLFLILCFFLTNLYVADGSAAIRLRDMIFPVVLYIVICSVGNSFPITIMNAPLNVFSIFRETTATYCLLALGVFLAEAGLPFASFDHSRILWPILFAYLLSMNVRIFYFGLVNSFFRSNYKLKTILLVVDGQLSEEVLQKVLCSPSLECRLYGFLADRPYKGLQENLHLGGIDRFSEIIDSGVVHEVLFAVSLKNEAMVGELIQKCEREGVRARLVFDLFSIAGNRPILEIWDGITLVGVRAEPLSILRNRMMKRSFDILFSSAFLLFFSPLYLAVYLAVKLSSPGPAIFRQERVGINNRKFWMYKFRSMYIQDKAQSDTRWTTDDDPRVTPIGQFLRRFNLDEIPQFWNVLVGDMSVVGPRPEREFFVNQFKKRIPNYNVRHQVKSGVTGWAQVNGWRGDTSIERRVECDIWYMENWSLWLDIKVIFYTALGKQVGGTEYRIHK